MKIGCIAQDDKKALTDPTIHLIFPFHMRQLEQELEKLEALDITEHVEGPMPWSGGGPYSTQ